MKPTCLLQASLLGFAWAFLVSPEANAGSPPRREDRMVGSSVDQLIARYGLPTHIFKRRSRLGYQWQLKAAVVFENDGLSRSEEFQCKVTAITSSRGRVIKLTTEVPDAGAGVLAAVGAFGKLCRKSFGVRSGRL